MPPTFLNPEEQMLGDRFLADGYVVVPVEDLVPLIAIRDRVADLAAEAVGIPSPADRGRLLDTIGERVTVAKLNDVRLSIIRGINAEPWLRPAYYCLARDALAALVGNELVMQRRINLSIQLPDDDSSLLPVHADVWSGDSPFETVVWLPLVDCARTKSMYLSSPASDAAVQARLAEFAGKSAEDIYQAIAGEVRFIEISFGQVLIFCQNLMHGNRINRERETRWSMNCRFKSVFSPYAEKKLGEFFEPITLRPATRLGMNYRLPGGFRG